MAFSWKCLFSMIYQFFAPGMNRAIRDPQLSRYLCDGFSRRFHQSDCFLLEFFCVDFLNFAHFGPFHKLGLVYLSFRDSFKLGEAHLVYMQNGSQNSENPLPRGTSKASYTTM